MSPHCQFSNMSLLVVVIVVGVVVLSALEQSIQTLKAHPHIDQAVAYLFAHPEEVVAAQRALVLQVCWLVYIYIYLYI
jgi:hypothetical protein